MKKRKKKNAITLLALVITIVIMLLLAGVAIQMTMGENGLIAKSVQAQKEQAKAELYDTAKLSYMSLNAKALENGQPSPEAELALSTTEFTNKYNIVGDDITDKKGTVIDTKDNVINEISGIISGDSSTIPVETWPKTVSGVIIPEEEKDKMIIKLKVIDAKAKIYFSRFDGNIIDYGTGNHTETADGVEFYNGEHIIKISKFENLTISDKKEGDYELELLQWGKLINENAYNPSMYLEKVSKIFEPEPDVINIKYMHGKMTEIPEWLLRKKTTIKEIQEKFMYCYNITRIPQNLLKYCSNLEKINNLFHDCKGITSIPENLFKYNSKLREVVSIFYGCTKITSIPVDLFKHNKDIEIMYGVFRGNTSLTTIPENLFKYNTKVKDFSAI